MQEIDPTRTDLIAEFDANPRGPHGHELVKLLHRLRLGPMADRYVPVCTVPGRQWAVGRMPTERGKPIEFVEGAVYDNPLDADRKVFRLRWQAATGQEPASATTADSGER